MLKRMWFAAAGLILLSGCGQLLGALVGTKEITENPLNLNGQTFLLTEPYQKLDVQARGEYIRPPFDDFVVEGASLTPYTIVLRVYLGQITFNTNCKGSGDKLLVTINQMTSSVSDRPNGQLRTTDGTPYPAEVKFEATRQSNGDYAFADNTFFDFYFGRALYDISTTGGMNEAFVKANIRLNNDTFEKCTSGLVVKDHKLIMRDLR